MKSEKSDRSNCRQTNQLLTWPIKGLFIVLRARWILCGLGETEGDGETVAEEDEEDEGGGEWMDLLAEGPETLIFARPGDKFEDVEGDEEIEEMDFAA